MSRCQFVGVCHRYQRSFRKRPPAKRNADRQPGKIPRSHIDIRIPRDRRRVGTAPGDVIVVDMHDTSEGLQIVLRDVTTGETGFMTASAANGFGQVKFDPYGTTCKNIPYDFHPMYSTSSEHTRVPWAAHSFNIAFSDEIGHFEFCSSVDANRNCAHPDDPPTSPTFDDFACFPASASSRVPIAGCLAADLDFDGPPYRLDWPGTFKHPGYDAELHPQPIRFTSALFRSKWGDWENYNRVAFEADFPVFELTCDPYTGTGCSSPPAGAEFYPFYSTAELTLDGDHDENACVWDLGGAHIPHTTNTFGGSAKTEFGSLIDLSFPLPGGSVTEFADYRRVLSANPCKLQAGR